MDARLINRKNDRILCQRSIKCIDYIQSKYPKVKLICCCLYIRGKINVSSLDKEFQYDELKKKYSNNILDIDKFISKHEFKSCIQDKGGYPNQKRVRIK